MNRDDTTAAEAPPSSPSPLNGERAGVRGETISGAQSHPSPEDNLFITALDHDAGYKDLEVRLRSGRDHTLRLYAIPARKLIRINAQWKALAERAEADSRDLAHMLAQAALSDPSSPSPLNGERAGVRGENAPTVPPTNILDLLAPESYELVTAAAYYLAYGLDAQKKMINAWRTIASQPKPTNSAPSSPSKPSSSATAGTQPTSPPSPSRGSSSSPTSISNPS
jgi:hypothetical protein